MTYVGDLRRALRVVIGLVREIPSETGPETGVVTGTYPGLNNHPTPVKIFTPKREARMTVILYPGASPHGEEHPGLIRVGYALARAGYQVYAPRVPPLKELLLTDEIVDWMVRFYTWCLAQPGVEPGRTTLIGLSFGGALVLRTCLESLVRERPPRSLLVYGTFYDIRTAFRFLLTGELEIDGKIHRITPNTWGLIVLFHNYLHRVDVGYPTTGVQEVLRLRVQDLEEEAARAAERLAEPERELAQVILQSRTTPEVNRILDLIWQQCRAELERGSPKYWCGQIHTRVFVMHGANDTMAPFTESVKLAAALPDSRLLISYLYEHREIATDRGTLFRLKELGKILLFLFEFLRYNEHRR
jgi:pimeloyl-ACP methyl ester carboxylesterase